MRKISWALIALFAVLFIVLHYFLQQQSEFVKVLVIAIVCGLFGYFMANKKKKIEL